MLKWNSLWTRYRFIIVRSDNHSCLQAKSLIARSSSLLRSILETSLHALSRLSGAVQVLAPFPFVMYTPLNSTVLSSFCSHPSVRKAVSTLALTSRFRSILHAFPEQTLSRLACSSRTLSLASDSALWIVSLLTCHYIQPWIALDSIGGSACRSALYLALNSAGDSGIHLYWFLLASSLRCIATDTFLSRKIDLALLFS